MSKVCNNGPRKTVMDQGNTQDYYGLPSAIINNQGHITGNGLARKLMHSKLYMNKASVSIMSSNG